MGFERRLMPRCLYTGIADAFRDTAVNPKGDPCSGLIRGLALIGRFGTQDEGVKTTRSKVSEVLGLRRRQRLPRATELPDFLEAFGDIAHVDCTNTVINELIRPVSGSIREYDPPSKESSLFLSPSFYQAFRDKC